jgi:hypothetical protein
MVEKSGISAFLSLCLKGVNCSLSVLMVVVLRKQERCVVANGFACLCSWESAATLRRKSKTRVELDYVVPQKKSRTMSQMHVALWTRVDPVDV